MTTALISAISLFIAHSSFLAGIAFARRRSAHPERGAAQASEMEMTALDADRATQGVRERLGLRLPTEAMSTSELEAHAGPFAHKCALATALSNPMWLLAVEPRRARRTPGASAEDVHHPKVAGSCPSGEAWKEQADEGILSCLQANATSATMA